MKTAPSIPGRLVLIVGPSGAGKDTLIDLARRELVDNPRIRFVQRTITRPASVGEDHNPMDVASFEQAIGQGAFALHWEAHGLQYGLPIVIDQWLAAGDVVVANGSRAMLHEARYRYPQLTIVNITAPVDILARRLVERGRESIGSVCQRLTRAETHLVDGADVVHIDNSDLPEIAAGKLTALLATEPNHSSQQMEQAMPSTFDLDIDLNRDGRQNGYLRVKASSEHSPFGSIMVPISSIRRGSGPCVVVMGGCHGDEYEGQIIARLLLASLDPAKVTGQIIILPAANPAAVRAGRRFSPADNGNLNTAFPGKADGTATQRIAHFIESVLLPRSNLVVDIHSGGLPVEYCTSAMMSGAVSGARREKLISLAKAFGLPVAFFVDEEDATPSSVLGACDRVGVLNISAEIGGGGPVRQADLEQGFHGVLRMLQQAGVLSAVANCEQPMIEVALLRRLPVSATVFAPEAGLFEPKVDLARVVKAGQLAGYIHDVDIPWKPPMPVHFREGGIVLCRRLAVRAEMGDGLFKLGVPIPS
ncbi:phosphonate metabolism protein/1,5-bisphosphokinase (PRPP-forming) PhnN [Rhizobium miluonense]|uniref:Ribose 1,5-bisphosphate phosphokinase PhnN n=1 Tax=Rhizobium miluonense TaxID=411945 RepID=A0A1C3WZN8_9HYPH|nr:phosphonate metabolism protein/1,5-bisphosphokinase (PRPP-forming) PhnN [Rhizobium miluonense]SCB45458.1 phosphonate metabolism protein/1,5-bisphosphokinase (PRPP-forming) PhnN [Rhizobium miluonense]